MLPKIWIFDSYGIMFSLGIIAAFVVMELYFRKHLKEKSSKIYYVEFCLLLGVMAGIVFAYLFQNLYNFIEDPENYSWSWSLTFYGGVIGGAGGFFIAWLFYGRKHYKEGLSKLAIVAPGCITLGHGLGRIGCTLAGCCYGKETDKWFGMQFTGLDHKAVPTNLFEAIVLFILAGVLIYLAFKKDSLMCFPIYLIGYGTWRFLIEYARGDHRGNFIPGLTPSQFWSVLLVIGGVIYLLIVLFLLRKKKEDK